MKIIFRADASFQIGTGHVMRCLTLADELRKKGAKIFFICRLLPGNLCDYIEQKGYLVYRLPYPGQPTDSVTDHAQLLGVNWQADAEETKTILAKEIGDIDWLIVDHYDLDIRWETEMRPLVKKIMVIDDLADRPHDCDLLLDQNLYDNLETRYQALVPYYCTQLMGPGYALLRSEFRDAQKNLRVRNGNVQRILIFFGGSDPTNETVKALHAIRLLNCPEINVDVVVGAANQHKEQIRKLCLLIPNSNFYYHVDNMAWLMANADLAIGAGGSTTWERCFLGLPTITIVIAQNQSETVAALAKRGAILNLGWYTNVEAEDIFVALKQLLNNPDKLKEMENNAIRLMESMNLQFRTPDYLLDKR